MRTGVIQFPSRGRTSWNNEGVIICPAKQAIATTANIQSAPCGFLPNKNQTPSPMAAATTTAAIVTYAMRLGAKAVTNGRINPAAKPNSAICTGKIGRVVCGATAELSEIAACGAVAKSAGSAKAPGSDNAAYIASVSARS